MGEKDSGLSRHGIVGTAVWLWRGQQSQGRSKTRAREGGSRGMRPARRGDGRRHNRRRAGDREYELAAARIQAQTTRDDRFARQGRGKIETKSSERPRRDGDDGVLRANPFPAIALAQRRHTLVRNRTSAVGRWVGTVERCSGDTRDRHAAGQEGRQRRRDGHPRALLAVMSVEVLVEGRRHRRYV